MTKNHESQAVVDIDALRRDLCQKMADGMRLGVFGFQIRVLHPGDSPTEAWLYVHQEHEWRKRTDVQFSATAAKGLLDELEHVATQEHADDWTCRRIEHSDRTDFELTFRREGVQSHVDDKPGHLESFLVGCLFFGHHDSGKDSRHRIRYQGH